MFYRKNLPGWERAARVLADIPFASSTLAEHLLRGAIGFAALILIFRLGAGHTFADIRLGVLCTFDG